MKNRKNLIIIALLIIIILTMVVGYSTFVTQLNVKGTAEITGEWNVRITNIETQYVSEGCDAGEPQYDNTNVTFYAKLVKPGDSITYLITIENSGNIDATLDSIIFKEQEDGSENIKFTTTGIAPILEAGNQTTLNVKVEYDPETSENPTIKTKTITGVIEYAQK